MSLNESGGIAGTTAAPGVPVTRGSRAGRSRTPRIAGLDVARGLAILGMFAAHIVIPATITWNEPASWIGVVNGRSAALFAVLAGISLALMTGRTTPVTGEALLRARLRVGSRAIMIFVLGGLLNLMMTGVAVILEYYAVAFLIALLCVSVRVKWLFVIAAGIMLIGPFVQIALSLLLMENYGSSVIANLMISGFFPVILWSGFVILGLGLGRLALDRGPVIGRIAIAGAALLVIGQGGAALLRLVLDLPANEYYLGMADWSYLLYAEPHSGSQLELLGAAGFAMLVIAAALSLPRAIQRFLYPLAATGKMALTAYVGHLIALAFLGGAGMFEGEPTLVLWLFILTTLVFCSLWIAFLRRGPLETLLTWLSRKAASTRSLPEAL